MKTIKKYKKIILYKKSNLKKRFKTCSNMCQILADLTFDQCFIQNLNCRGWKEVILVTLES